MKRTKRVLTGMGSNRGDTCTFDGREWQCIRFTTEMPGPDAKDWQPVTNEPPNDKDTNNE